MNFRTVSQVFVAGAVAFVLAAGGFSLYASGYIDEIRRRTIAADSGPAVRSELLGEAERVTGARGVTGALREYALTGEARHLVLADQGFEDAQSILGRLAERTWSADQTQGAAELAGLLSSLRALRSGAVDLEQDVLLARITGLQERLSSAITAMERTEVLAQFKGTQRVIDLTRGVVIFSFFGSFSLLLFAAAAFRSAVRRPLTKLAAGLEDMANARDNGRDMPMPEDLTARSDEIGDVARIVQKMFDHPVALEQRLVLPEGRVNLDLSGPSGQVLDQVLEKVRGALDDIAERGQKLDGVREEAATRSVEEVTRLAAAIGDLEAARRTVDDMVGAQRKELNTVTTDLRSAVKLVGDVETGLRETIDRSVTDLSARTQDLSKVTDSLTTATARVSGGVDETLLGVGKTQETVNALLGEARKTNETVVTVSQGMTDQMARMVNDINAKVEQMQQGAGRFDSMVQDMGDAVSAYRSEAEQTYNEVSGRLTAAADAIEALLQGLGGTGQGDNVDDGRLGENVLALGKTLASGLDQVRAAMEKTDARMGALEDRLSEAPGEAQVASGPSADVEKVMARLDDLAAALADLGQQTVTADQSDPSGILSEMETRLSGSLERSETITERMEAAVKALQERLEEVAQERGAPEAGAEPIPVTDLRACIEDVMAPFLAVGGEAQAATLPPLVQDLVDRVDTLARAMEARADASEGHKNGFAEMREAVDALAHTMETQMDRMMSAVSSSTPISADGSVVDHDGAMVPLRDLTIRLEADAKDLFERIEHTLVSGLPPREGAPSMDDVVGGLTELVQVFKDRGLIEPDQDSLAKTVTDIDALADVIDGLERRSAALARRLMDAGAETEAVMDEIGVGDLSAQEPAQAIARLQDAGAKLDNIATAVAIASDTCRLKSAS